MGNSDEGDRLPAPSSSDELSSILRQVLSRAPTAQPSFSPKKIVSSAEMFNRTFPLVPGGAVSYAACAAAETGEGKCGFENKRNGARQRNSLKRNIDAQFHNLSEKTDKASMLDEAIEYLKQLQLQFQTLAAMNGLGLNPLRLPPILPPTQTRITGTSEQGLNLETLLGGSHSMANREPPETQEMCFPTTTLL